MPAERPSAGSARDAALPRRPGFGLPVLAGVLVVAAFFGAFGGWAALAPLDSAAIAPGIVSVEGNRKTVQHLEGGIVERILVREGQRVRKGQMLIALEETQPRTALEVLRGRLLATAALEARLIAERDGAERVAFPAWIEAQRGTPQADEAIGGQTAIFEGRREALARQIAVLKQKSAQSREEIGGLRGQIAAERKQLGLLALEIDDVRTLVDKGLARKARLLALERGEAEVVGSRARNVAAIARARQAITEAELRVAELRTTMLNEAVASLRETQTELFDISERIRAAEDVLKRIGIVAPIDGTVVNLQVHTAGGVITPGQALMDIVPEEDRRIVEARIDPSDIDVVHPGLEALVRLTALPQRNLVPLRGAVLTVSADRLVDDKTGQAYFSARVALTDDVSSLPGGALYPGMQAEVMIVTGARTLLDYVTQPLLQSFNRALRES